MSTQSRGTGTTGSVSLFLLCSGAWITDIHHFGRMAVLKQDSEEWQVALASNHPSLFYATPLALFFRSASRVNCRYPPARYRALGVYCSERHNVQSEFSHRPPCRKPLTQCPPTRLGRPRRALSNRAVTALHSEARGPDRVGRAEVPC